MKIKKITVRWLKKHHACCSYDDMVKAEKIGNPIFVLKALIKENRLNDANWLITKVMTKKQCIKYAIYAAKQVLHIYEEQYPNDKRPRKAIQAAKKYLDNPTQKNKNADAAYAAVAVAADAAAADAADAAAAYAAAAAADAVAAVAAYAADAVADAVADAAAYAADAVAAYAADAVAAAKQKLRLKILKYGIKILKENTCKENI